MTLGRFVWPSATRPWGYQLTFEVGRQVTTISFPWGSFEISVPINPTIQMFSMPDDWETRDTSGRVRGETVAHELDTTSGCPTSTPATGHPQASKDRDLASTTAAGATWC